MVRAAPAENDPEQDQRNSNLTTTATQIQPTTGSQPAAAGAKGPTTASGPNNVAPSPQLVAAQAGALAAELATSAASVQALGFYRIPLFLLPIYQAAAVQYGVPWQILAAINEIETDYGTDLSVSSAGAVGWMQFMPSTWLQYGVDALDAGYADPYNPVDAIFAAARYLHAAGAAKNLRTAILAYNHSEEYAESVLLRAKLISSYPKSVIATLTGLVDARLPVTASRSPGARCSRRAPLAARARPRTRRPSRRGQATASSAGDGGLRRAGRHERLDCRRIDARLGTGARARRGSGCGQRTAALRVRRRHSSAAPQFVELLSAPNASVVAVQDGRVLGLGRSHRLGKYVILRDIYGDVFTYAGLGSIAPSYRLPNRSPIRGARRAAAKCAGPRAPASAGDQRR